MSSFETKVDAVLNCKSSMFTDLVAAAEMNPMSDLRGRDLCDVDFSGCELRSYRFHGSMLDGAIFSKAWVVLDCFDSHQIKLQSVKDAINWTKDQFQNLASVNNDPAMLFPKIDTPSPFFDSRRSSPYIDNTEDNFMKLYDSNTQLERAKLTLSGLYVEKPNVVNRIWKNVFGATTFPLDIWGFIPKLRKNNDMVDSLRDHRSSVSEAYASLRTRIKNYETSRTIKVIMVTSTMSGEGKSTTALGVASRFAGLGEKVLLIDADLRLPTFRSSSDSGGLTELLTDSYSNIEKVIETTNFENLYLVPSGRVVPNPTELLGTNKFADLVEDLRGRFDRIVIDAPPVLALADAPSIATIADVCLFVGRYNDLKKKQSRMALERLIHYIPNIGLVVTFYKSSFRFLQKYSNYQYSYGMGNYESRFNKKKHGLKKRKLDL